MVTIIIGMWALMGQWIIVSYSQQIPSDHRARVRAFCFIMVFAPGIALGTVLSGLLETFLDGDGDDSL